MYQRLIWAVVAILGISAASVAAEADDEATMIVAPGAAIILQPADPSHRVEVAIDGGLVQPVRGALRAPDSGKHWLSVVSRDAGGNVSEARWYYLVVDDEAPAVELDFSKPPAADVHDVEWLQAGTTVTTRAVDRLSGLSGVSLEASGPADSDLEAAGEVDATLRLTAEGTYELRAEAMDVVENRSEVVSATYRVDGTGPEGRIFAEGPHIEAEGRFILGPGAELHVEMNDELSGLVHWSPLIDGTEVEKPDFHSGWAAGEHTASGHMMDLVGNHAQLTPQSFYFDDQGPEVQWQIENEIRSGCSERQLVVPPVQVSFTAMDEPAGVSTFETSIDGTLWNAAEGSRILEGDRLNLRARDAVGNETTIHAQWDLDVTPPQVALVDSTGTAHAPGERFDAVDGDVLKIQISDDGCNVPDVRYRYEDGRSINAIGRVIPVARKHCFIRPLFDRYCRITVEAIDQFGRESIAIFRVKVARPEREIEE